MSELQRLPFEAGAARPAPVQRWLLPAKVLQQGPRHSPSAPARNQEMRYPLSPACPQADPVSLLPDPALSLCGREADGSQAIRHHAACGDIPAPAVRHD